MGQSCFVGISGLFKTSWFFVCPSTVWPKAALIRPFDGWSALIERMCCQNDAKSGSWEGNTDRWWRTQNQALPFQNPEKVGCSPSITLGCVCHGELVIVPPSLLILCMYAYCGQSGWDQILICCLEICIFRRQSIFPTCSSYLLLDLAWRKPLLFNSILDLRKMTMETNLILWPHGKNISKILCKPTFNATA